jgi:hypothetical protein
MRALKTIAKTILSLILLLPATLIAQNQKDVLSQVKFEHLRINVADKETTAKWYVDNADLEIIPSDNREVVYVADKDHNFMIEFSSVPGIRNTYFDINLEAFHLAFEGHKSIEAVAEKMLADKGVKEGTFYRNQIGDYVMNVRDPNGFTAQLIHRVNPFYPEPVKGTIRFEHFAYNTPDQKNAALWLVEFMDLQIPWSKDIDTTKNNFRNYSVPYVGDAARSMSLELLSRKEVEMTFAKMSHQECHIAFTTDDPERLAKRMVYGGAKIIGGIQKSANGDIIIDLRDPSDFPIRLIKRHKTILIK